jgi:hypothetical protein
MGFCPIIQHTDTHIAYTIPISHTYKYIYHTNNITKTNKKRKNNSAHKATQTVEGILQPMNTVQKKVMKYSYPEYRPWRPTEL